MPVNMLLVDDSDVIRRMILKTMQLANIPLGVVFEASNGREALEVLEDEWIDVVLADINMPVMDGSEFIERVRGSERFSDIPIVVISTEGAEQSVEQLREMGVQAYIRKPFTPEQIRDVITDVAGRIVTTEHREMLEGVIAEILDMFTMMYGEASETDGDGPPEDDLVRARMSFTGAATGSLTVAAPASLCRQMAAHALGIDIEDKRSAERASDAVGEFVNMTCGYLATNLDAERATRLSPPEVSRMSTEAWSELAGATGTVTFLVEGRPMLASLGLRAQ